MPGQPDLLVYAPNHEVKLLVEVKGLRGVSDQWLTGYRQALAELNAIPASAYFMLALPEHIYLWKPGSAAAPDYKARTGEAMQEHLNAARLETIGGDGLEIVAIFWLNYLAEGAFSKDSAQRLRWVVESGLRDAINKGKVVAPAAA